MKVFYLFFNCETNFFCFKFNQIYEIVVTTDKIGMIEYWTGPRHEYEFPKNVLFESKMDTDLYEFAKVNYNHMI